MGSYEKLFEQATSLRVKHHQPAAAIDIYRQALRITGPHDREILHMIGVCCQMERCYAVALLWYRRAFVGANAYERGNIERDRGEAFSALGQYDRAEASFAAALRLLPYGAYPSEHAATQGFLARHLLRQGRLQEAIQQFAYADRLLHMAGVRETELYNKLAYASALAAGGRPIQSRRVALQALCLARHYGAPAHQQRALAVIAAGHLGDQLLARVRRHQSHVNCADFSLSRRPTPAPNEARLLGGLTM